MYSLLRSLIFKLDPELSHNLAIKSLKFNYSPVKNIIIDRSNEKLLIKDKITSQIKIKISTYKENALPEKNKNIEPIKPGSRNIF